MKGSPGLVGVGGLDKYQESIAENGNLSQC